MENTNIQLESLDWYNNSKSEKLYLIPQSSLRDIRRTVLIENDYICPVLGKKIQYEKSTFDHSHKLKNDECSITDNKGMLRGVLSFDANAWEGKVYNAFKRLGLEKENDFGDCLIRLGNYINSTKVPQSEKPWYMNIVHPLEAPKLQKVSKTEFNFIKKYLDLKHNKDTKLKYTSRTLMTQKYINLLQEATEFKELLDKSEKISKKLAQSIQDRYKNKYPKRKPYIIPKHMRLTPDVQEVIKDLDEI